MSQVPNTRPPTQLLPLQDAIEIQFTYCKQNPSSPSHLRMGCIQLNEFGFVTDVVFDGHHIPNNKVPPQSRLFQLSNFHKTLHLKSSNQTENDGEFSQSFIMKPNLSPLFTHPKEPLDTGFKHFLKDFQKQSLKGMNFVEALYPSKFEIAQELGLINAENDDDSRSENLKALADPLRAYRGRTKCVVFYLEGDFASVLTPQSNLVVEWGKHLVGELPHLSKTEFKSENKLVFPYQSLTKQNKNCVFLSLVLWMDPEVMNQNNVCAMDTIGVNLGPNSPSIMDAYKYGLIHQSLGELYSSDETAAVLRQPYKYFELKKNNSVVLSSLKIQSVRCYTFEINHILVGKKFSINSKAILLDRGNYAIKHIGEPVFVPGKEKPVISGRTDTKSDATFSIDLNHIPSQVDKILFISVFQGNAETNFIRVKDSVMKVFNEKKELVTSIVASPGNESTLIWGFLKRLPDNGNSSESRWELYNMDQYTDQHGPLGAYRYAVRHLPIVSPLSDTVNTCPMLSNSSSTMTTTVEFSLQKPLLCKLRLGKRLAPYLFMDDEDDDDEDGFSRKLSKKPYYNLDVCFFDNYGYHIHHESAKPVKSKYMPLFQLGMKEHMANLPNLKTAFIKLALRIPCVTYKAEPYPYYDTDFTDEVKERSLSDEFVKCIQDESMRMIICDEEKNEELFGVSIQDLDAKEQEEKLKKIKLKEKHVIKPEFEAEVLLLKLEKVDQQSDLWKVCPIRKELAKDSNWVEKIRQEMLSEFVKARPPFKLMHPNECVTHPFVSDLYKEIFTSVISLECSDISYKPKLHILTPTNVTEVNEQNSRYGNPMSVEIIMNSKRFSLPGENSRFEIAYKDYELQNQMLGIILCLELSKDIPSNHTQSTLVLKFFDQTVGGEKFRLVVDPLKCGWKKQGELLTVLATMKDVATHMISIKCVMKINLTDYAVLLPSPPKHLNITIDRAEDLAVYNDKNSDPYIVAKFDDGKKKVSKKKTALFVTHTIKKTLNPVWNETFQIRLIGDIKADNRVLAFHMYDKETLHKDNYMGMVLLNVKDVQEGCFAYPLKPNPLKHTKAKEAEKVKGKVFLKFEFVYD
ncbi:hypothetical protein C9374_003355 [Naegleria lovaniensis]|uniref:C2 domain-containing protein n=1 Tax=Naegleria lovaniensis TaxID=51637 RepID=A0AA88KJE1_NAELO|nr:uncharacterized protein C9374_003355 [Naegleria lovaniensis]KAG2385540.1 hypothetical protein C9374_003355 [Naegleria lovaniensis]